jgi:ArsR family transcriptional regulator, arsenate/arsenite/antimonite-responsive transcriptional repressor
MKDLARWLKATADPTRLRMLDLLCRHGELCVCDLQNVLEISQSSASRHLRTLREAGLVTDRRRGMWIDYALAAQDDAQRRRLMDELLADADAQGERAELDRRLDDWLATKLVDGPTR